MAIVALLSLGRYLAIYLKQICPIYRELWQFLYLSRFLDPDSYPLVLLIPLDFSTPSFDQLVPNSIMSNQWSHDRYSTLENLQYSMNIGNPRMS